MRFFKIFFLVLLIIGLKSYSQQRVDLDFNTVTSHGNNCNDYKNNYNSEWLPSHGSPDLIDRRKIKLNARVIDFKKRSEGVFIDLNSKGFNFKEGSTYKITMNYQRPHVTGWNQFTFRACLVNNIREESKEDCSEGIIPNIGNVKKIYYKPDYLKSTYTGQVKEVSSEFMTKKNYKYLWIYSDMITTYGDKSELETGYLTRVVIQEVTNFPKITNNKISGNQSIYSCSETDEITGTIPNGGNKIYSYSWQEKTGDLGWINIRGETGQSYTPKYVGITTEYRRVAKSANIISYSNSVEVKVNHYPRVTNNTIYFDGDSKFIGSIPLGGNGNYKYDYHIILDNDSDLEAYYPDHSKDLELDEYHLSLYKKGHTLCVQRDVYSSCDLMNPSETQCINYEILDIPEGRSELVVDSASVYPNPTTGFVKFKINSKQNRKVKIFINNIYGLGRSVKVFDAKLNKGKNLISYSFPKTLDKGLYNYTILSEKNQIIGKGNIFLK